MASENPDPGGSDGDGAGQKAVNEAALARSVVDSPEVSPVPALPSLADSLLFLVAEAADEIQAWGRRPKSRDKQLREFYPTEAYFNSALGSVVGRNAAFSYTLEGPPRTVRRVKDVLEDANQGKGWQDLQTTLSTDLYTQDHGAFLEVVRAGDSPDAALIGLNHLDAARCWHTGDPRAPVIYQDMNAKYHLLKWYQVVTLSENPTPIEGLYGLQQCVLTRVMRATQLIRNIMMYMQEKTGGRFNRAIHIVKGITTQQIRDAQAGQALTADQQGALRFIAPLVIGSIDPGAPLDIKTLELASLPNGFNQEEQLKWYIIVIAMGFMGDYQDFAPLPGGNLGTGAQSQILHLKAGSKGALLYQKLITHALNHEILPKTVEFLYTEQDVEQERGQAQVSKLRAERRKIDVETGVLTEEAARQQALDDGDISQEIFDGLGGIDLTEQVRVEDVEQEPREKPPTPQLPPPPAEEEEEEKQAKRPKAEVGYRLGDDLERMCSVCQFFQGPARCQLVQGAIRPQDTCDLFQPRYQEGQTWLAAERLVQGVDEDKAANISEFLQSRLHRAFTDASDDLYALGYMDTPERIELSSVIDDVLGDLEKTFGRQAADIVNRNVSDEDARTLLTQTALTIAAEKQARAGPFEEDRLDAEAVFADALLKALRKIRTNVVRRLPRERRTKETLVGGSFQHAGIKAKLADDDKFWAQQKADFLKSLENEQADLLRQGAGQATRLGLAVDFDLVNQQVLNFVPKYNDQWWNRLQKIQRDTLRGAIQTNIQSGAPLRSLVKDIEPLFGRARAETIASTEVTRLFAEGNVMAYKTSGVDQVEWRTVRDSRVDPICDALDKQRWPVDNPEEMPPAHPRCRCWLAPIVDDDLLTRKV